MGHDCEVLCGERAGGGACRPRGAPSSVATPPTRGGGVEPRVALLGRSDPQRAGKPRKLQDSSPPSPPLTMTLHVAQNESRQYHHPLTSRDCGSELLFRDDEARQTSTTSYLNTFAELLCQVGGRLRTAAAIMRNSAGVH